MGWHKATSEFNVLLVTLTVWAFLAYASTTPAADFCPAFVAFYNASSHSRQPRQISRDKLDRLLRATAEFTTRVLDGYGLRDRWLARPTP